MTVDLADPARRPLQLALPETAAAAFAMGVLVALREAGHDAFLVGGCVRDLVLGIEPKDYDVATSARPEQVSRLFPRVVEVGASFGVVCVLSLGPSPFAVEVATFRADLEYQDGRRPVGVRFVGVEQDVLRRDFTMNGLLLDLGRGPEAPLTLVDLVDGIADLRAGRLRAIGDPRARFGEDALRLLRAVRFAARFGLTIEAETSAAMRELAPRLAMISRERVRMELEHMLQPASASAALQLLADHSLDAVVLSELAAADPGLARAIARMRRLVDEASLDPTPQAGRPPSHDAFAVSRGLPISLALAALAEGALPATDLGGRFRLATEVAQATTQTDSLAAAFQGHLLGEGLHGLVHAPALIRLLRADHADAALRLLHARLPELAGAPVTARAQISELRRLRAATPRSRWWPTPFVDGARLQAVGCAPGPRFRLALDAAMDAQLAGADAAACMAVALDKLGPAPGAT